MLILTGTRGKGYCGGAGSRWTPVAVDNYSRGSDSARSGHRLFAFRKFFSMTIARLPVVRTDVSWRWPNMRAAAGLVLAALLAWPVCTAGDEQAKPAPKTEEPAQELVKVVVDYGDGVQKHFTSIPWKEEMTVFTALEAAGKHSRGVKITHQGKGETVLVTAIDDLKNEGRGRNWLYEVNGKLGDRSSAVMPLKAGDSVLWRFRKYE